MESAIDKKIEIRRDDIFKLENAISQMEGAVHGDSDMMPLKHSFAEGVYVREIFIPKGTILTGKIHRHSHPNFLLKGEVIVATEDGGRQHLKAPLSMISKAGTKRAVMALEDTVWVTVHVTEETDLEKIEKHVIAPTYEDLLDSAKGPGLESELAKKNCLILALKEKGRDYSCLLELKAVGTLLPFKSALATLKEHNISIEGLFAEDNGESWHVTTTVGQPLGMIILSDEDMAGTWIASGYYGYKTLSKKNTISEPPEISGARKKLSDFSNTGKFGDFTAGAEIPLGYGDYGMTGIEQQGQSSLQNLLNSGIPDQFKMGDMALQDLLQTSPDAINKQFQPFNTITDRNTQDALTAQKRAAAFGGNLYTSRNIKALGDIGAKGNETKTQYLANLTNDALNRRLQAIPLAYQSGNQQEALVQNRIAASQQYGGLSRQLNDASIKARDAELLRRRQELQLPIQAATNILGSNWTPPVSSSPYGDLLSLIGTGVGAYFGGPAGATAGNKIGSSIAGNQRTTASNSASAGYSA